MQSNPKDLLDDETFRKQYSKLNLRKVTLILEKYRNDKVNPKECAGNTEIEKLVASGGVKEVHKSEAQGVAKKLREKLNFK